MASVKRKVQFSGVLRGEGHVATCTGSVTKTTEPVTGISAYTGLSIENLSKPLPNGNYELTANGEIIRVRHHGNEWLAQI